MKFAQFSLILCLLVHAAVAFAQDTSHLAPPKRSAQAIKTATPPVIDGDISDETWKAAPVLGDFVDVRTDQLAEHQTNVQLLYDDEFLYVAWEVFQPKELITANIYKYDRLQLRFEDYVQIGLDTFHDKTQAYLFLVSPLGTRWDGRDGLFERNQSWDAEWEAATTILPDRWYAEMRIPIGVMHHDQEQNETWGLNFRRRISRDGISTHWNYDPDAGVPRDAEGPRFIADFGLLEGLDLSNMKVQRDPQVETYVSSTTAEREGGNTHYRLSTGLDADLRLSSHWTTQFTLNPDFGEIAADEGDIQNRDTARFLFERRNFFKDGAELFKSPTIIYDTRQITDIDTAAKIVGTGQDWTLASLVLRGDGTRAGEDADILVSRYVHSATEDLQLGATAIGVNRQTGHNATLAVDSRYKFTPTLIWTTQAALKTGENPIAEGSDDTLDREGHQLFSEFTWDNDPWGAELVYREVDEEFDPDLGFIPRKDIRGPELMVTFSEDYQGDVLEQVFSFFEYEYYDNFAGETVLRDYSLFSSFGFQNDLGVRFWVTDDFHVPYENERYSVGFEINQDDRYRSWEFDYAIGDFQDVDFTEYILGKPFKLSERWTNDLIGVLRQEQREDGVEDVWLWRLESEYTTQWDLRTKLTLESTNDRAYKRTLLFAYEDVKDWDFFLVFNDFRDPEFLDEETYRSIFVKFIYHW